MATQTQTQTSTHPTTITATPSTIPRGPVTATLNYFSPPADGSKPHNYVESPPPGQPQRNFGDNPTSTLITDIRGSESSYSLDANAFAALTDVGLSTERDFTDDAAVQRNYYPEVEKTLLERIPGSPHRVLIFDHTIRRAGPDAKRGPVQRAHIDQTTASAHARVRHHLPDEAAELLKGRVRLINVWRPINGTVESSPLAFADGSTLRDEDLVGIEHRYPDRTGETAAVRANEGQKWCYWSGIGNEERLLLQCFDSEKGARVPHSAFVDPRSGEAAKGRESIEVRALVFG